MPSRERSLRTEAVILRHLDWGEADRLLWIFTREQGKIRIVAKGVRKLRSRKAGHLEPFIHANLLLAYGREMWIVTQAETVQAFIPLREDLRRLGYASYVIELLDRFTYEEGENKQLFHLLVDTLGLLSAEPDPAFAVRYYEVRLLDLVGYRPQLFHCVSCHNPIQAEDQFFSASLGGVLCPRCGAGGAEGRPISVGALRLLRHFQRSTYQEARRLRLNEEVDREIEVLMQHFFTYLLERGLNTPAFLKRVKRLDRPLEETEPPLESEI